MTKVAVVALIGFLLLGCKPPQPRCRFLVERAECLETCVHDVAKGEDRDDWSYNYAVDQCTSRACAGHWDTDECWRSR